MTAAEALRKVCASRLNYRLSFAIDIAIPLVFLGIGLYRSADTDTWDALDAAACFCAGVFVFTFIEYALHRWVYHAESGFAVETHHQHHVSPRAPTAMPCAVDAMLAVLLWWIASLPLGATAACFFMSGMAAMYLYYGVLHHLQHHVRASSVPLTWLKTRWTLHAIHHGTINRNFGVTTSLWDHVFGTYRRSLVHERLIDDRA